MSQYWIYIICNDYKKVFYTGVSNNLKRRIPEHKNRSNPKSFSARYNLHRLIYFEVFDNINNAIVREKQIKAGSRQKKIELIESVNPEWRDLYFDIY